MRDLERFFYGSAVAVTLDSKNRFVLPSSLVEYIQTKSKVVLSCRDTYRIMGRGYISTITENYGKCQSEKLQSALDRMTQEGRVKMKQFNSIQFFSKAVEGLNVTNGKHFIEKPATLGEKEAHWANSSKRRDSP